MISECKNLKVIARAGVGYDMIDVKAAASLGIPVVITPGSNARSVAEHALAMMFALSQNEELEALLRASDIVSLHVPFMEKTRNMISEDELAMMKPSAILINCARGGVVDESAIRTAEMCARGCIAVLNGERWPYVADKSVYKQ